MHGQTRADWEAALVAYEGNRTDYLIMRGLAKVLTDAGTFVPRATAYPPIEVRRRLFERGPVFAAPEVFHPHTRTEMVQQLAAEVGISATELEMTLFADRGE